MPIYTPPFSVQEFNKFPTRSQAAEAVKNGDPHLHERLREIIKKYQFERRFGVGLVYKHFDILPGQAPFYNQFIGAEYVDPEIIRDIELHGEAEFAETYHIRPIAWAMTSSNKLMPYQFICYAKDGTHPIDPRYPGWQNFIDEFMHEIEWADLRPYVGLKLLQLTDRHDLISKHNPVVAAPRPVPVPGVRQPRSRTPSPGPRAESRTERRASYYLPIPDWRDRVASGEVSPDDLGLKQDDFRSSARDSGDEKMDDADIPLTPESCIAAHTRGYGERLGTPTEEAAEERREATAGDGK